MKKILTIFLLFFTVSLFAQNSGERFRRDFNYFSVHLDGEWSSPVESSTTFVFNVNDNGDLIYYSPQGKRHDFRNIRKLESGVTLSGEDYQVALFLDEDGSECYLQLFDNYSMGLKLIFTEYLFIHFF